MPNTYQRLAVKERGVGKSETIEGDARHSRPGARGDEGTRTRASRSEECGGSTRGRAVRSRRTTCSRE